MRRIFHQSNLAIILAILSLVAATKAEEKSEPKGEWSFFGIGSCHINGRSVKDYERWVPEMANLGIHYNRSLQAGWGSVEPKKGEWSWGNADEQWAYLQEKGIETGIILIGSPSWNKSDPPGHLPVNNLEGWSEYVFQTVKHFSGKVKYFEVWNEPPNFTGKVQTPEDYAKIVIAAYEAAKRANPDCQIGLAAKSVHIAYLRSVILAGAKDHFDWISLHPYEVLEGISKDTGLEAVFFHIVPTLRKMLQEVNPEKADVPLTYTELGCDAKRLGEETQASTLVKAYVLAAASGVSSVQWFEGRDGDSGPLGLLDGKGKPRLAFHSYAQLVKTLGQEPNYLGWVSVAGDGYGLVFQKEEEQPVMVAWTLDREGAELNWRGAELQAVSAISGEEKSGPTIPLGRRPVFLTGIPEKVIDQAKANREKPLTRRGDFSKAESVSLTFGGDWAEEHGLFSRSGDSVGEAVVAYGGSARAGDVPGGNLFVVAPEFLSYDRKPIEIILELRRKDPKQTAGFNLRYESLEGFKSTGNWYTIPESDQWHTARFRIEDPCFVSYWGYHFVLDSDGQKFSQYMLRKVEVRNMGIPAHE